MKLPEPFHSVPNLIYEWHRTQADDGMRTHLGASVIGHECMAYLWHLFHWSAVQYFDGRMLRLFRRGQNEENEFLRELQGIGAEISACDGNGQQWRVSAHGGHFGGSLDACVRNIPGGSPKKWELSEFKTHNKKSFDHLEQHGVHFSKPMHAAQMDVYGYLTGMTRANYLAVCKDDDRLYYERIEIDEANAQKMLERAKTVIFSPSPLEKISHRPDWWQCKNCHFHGLCHGSAAPIPTCRTCAHVTPTEDGTWLCEKHSRILGTNEQKKGCDSHLYHPDTLAHFAALSGGDTESALHYTLHTGQTFTNGVGGFSSGEIHACEEKTMLADPGLLQLRSTFGARIAGK